MMAVLDDRLPAEILKGWKRKATRVREQFWGAWEPPPIQGQPPGIATQWPVFWPWPEEWLPVPLATR